MIFLATFRTFTPSIFPVLGLIALIISLLSYLLLLFKMKDKDKFGFIEMSYITLVLASMGISIYGILAGIVGFWLFISALMSALLPTIIFVFIVFGLIKHVKKSNKT